MAVGMSSRIPAVSAELARAGASTPLDTILQNRSFGATTPLARGEIGIGRIMLYIGLVVLVAGALALSYRPFLYPKIHLAEGLIIGHGYTPHTVTVGGQKLEVSFDKSAESKRIDPNEMSLYGNELNGKKVYLDLAYLTAKSDFQPTSPLCGNIMSSYTVLQNVSILGSSYPLCGANVVTSVANAQANSTVGTIFQAGGKWYELELTTTSVSQPVNMTTATEVAQSISRKE